MMAFVSQREANNLYAYCAGLGSVDTATRTYQQGDECLICVQDLARALRNESKEQCEVQRELGKRDIIHTDLIPIIIQCEPRESEADQKLGYQVVKLMVMLTMRPNDLAECRPELVLILQKYKRSFANGPFWLKMAQMVLEALEVEDKKRKDFHTKGTELILTLMRNVLQVSDPPTEQIHDRLVRAMSENYMLEAVVKMANLAKADPLASKQSMLLLECVYTVLQFQRPDRVAEAHNAAKAAENKPKTASYGQQARALFLQEQENKRHQMSKGNIARRQNRMGSMFAVVSNTGQRLTMTGGMAQVKQGTLGDEKTARRRPKATDYETRSVESSADTRNVYAGFISNFIKEAYNLFMDAVFGDIRREKDHVLDSDRMNFVWVIWFATAFARHSQLPHITAPNSTAKFDVREVAITLKTGVRDHLLKLFDSIADLMKLERDTPKDVHGRRQHVVVRTLHEYVATVGAMVGHGDTQVASAGTSLLLGIIQSGQLCDRIVKLLREFKPSVHSLGYAQEVVHATDTVLCVLKAYVEEQDTVYVNAKRRRKKKAQRASQEGEEGSEQPAEETQPDPREEMEESEEEDHARAFDFNRFLMDFAHPGTVSTLTRVLEAYRSNSGAVNNALAGHLRRLAVDCNVPAMLYRLDVFAACCTIMTDRSTESDPHQKALRPFIKELMAGFRQAVQKNPFLYVELLFCHQKKAAITMLLDEEDLDSDQELSSRRKWTEEEDQKLRQSFEKHRQAADVAEAMLGDMEGRNTEAIYRRLKKLGIVSGKKDMYNEPESEDEEPTEWTEEDDKQLRENYAIYDNNAKRLQEVAAMMSRTVSVYQVERRLRKLGLLKKRRSKKPQQKTTKSFSDLSASSSSDDSGDEEAPTSIISCPDLPAAISSLLATSHMATLDWLAGELDTCSMLRATGEDHEPYELYATAEHEEAAVADPVFQAVLTALHFTPPTDDQESSVGKHWHLPSGLGRRQVAALRDMLLWQKDNPGKEPEAPAPKQKEPKEKKQKKKQSRQRRPSVSSGDDSDDFERHFAEMREETERAKQAKNSNQSDDEGQEGGKKKRSRKRKTQGGGSGDEGRGKKKRWLKKAALVVSDESDEESTGSTPPTARPGTPPRREVILSPVGSPSGQPISVGNIDLGSILAAAKAHKAAAAAGTAPPKPPEKSTIPIKRLVKKTTVFFSDDSDTEPMPPPKAPTANNTQHSDDEGEETAPSRKAASPEPQTNDHSPSPKENGNQSGDEAGGHRRLKKRRVVLSDDSDDE